MLKLVELEPVFRQFTNETKIEVSQTAKELIVNLINSVESDPHETWDVDEGRLNEYYSEWKAILPELLHQTARRHRLISRMTVIDVVHWSGYNLIRLGFPVVACPFPSRDELPPTSMMRFPWGSRVP